MVKKSGPDWRPDDWVAEHEPRWQLISDVYQHFSSESLRSRHLKRAIGERDLTYAHRVELSTMDPILKEAIVANAGLLSAFTLNEESPEDLQSEQTDVDNQGNNLKLFLSKVVSECLRFECVLLGCHLPTAENSSSPDSRKPYFSCNSIPADVFAPRVRTIDGEKVLTQISIKSSEKVDYEDGFGYEERDVYWVYRLTEDQGVTLQKYARENSAKKGSDQKNIVPAGEEVVLTNIRKEPLDRLPFVWLGIDPFSTVGSPELPPFLALAEKLKRIFNMESELDNVQRRVNIPLPKQSHETVPDEPEDITLSADSVWHHQKGCEVGFAEPTGRAMEISNSRIQELKTEVKAEQDRFLGVTTPQTATASLLDAGQMRMTLETIATCIESAVEQLFKLWVMYSDRSFDPEKSYGGITINLTSLKPPPTLQDIQTVPVMLDAGVLLDSYEARAKAKELGYLTDEIEESAKEMRENPTLAAANLNGNGDRPLATVNLEESGGRENAVDNGG